MGVKANTIYNYIGQSYTTLVVFFALPLYLHLLGAESFGLISLFVILQAWLRIFDMGLMPVLAREVAFYRQKTNGFIHIRQVLRCLEIIFFILNCFIMILILLGSRWIAQHWLKIEKLDYSEISYCIVTMGLIICLRWFSDLYRSGILSLEKQLRLNIINMLLVTLQYAGGFIILNLVSTSPFYFFLYQLFVSILELIILGINFYYLIPKTNISFLNCYIPWKLIKNIFPFASSIAYTSMLWTFLVESNKLFLSHVLPLSDYGYFALVITILNGLIQFITPIREAILPKMTFLLSQNNKDEMKRLYRNATQMMTIIIITLHGITAIFGTELVYAWTGDQAAASWAGPILFWYALGNSFLSISAFQYYLQYAHGELKLNVIINTFLVIIITPTIIFSAYFWGAVATGIVWFLMGMFIFFIVPPIVHHKYTPGIQKTWLLKDILPIFSSIIVTLICIKIISINFNLQSFNALSVFTIIVFSSGVLASSVCRNYLLNFFSK